MRIKITGRNIELTDGIKDAVEDKLNKLEKYFTPDTDVYVTLSVEKETGYETAERSIRFQTGFPGCSIRR